VLALWHDVVRVRGGTGTEAVPTRRLLVVLRGGARVLRHQERDLSAGAGGIREPAGAGRACKRVREHVHGRRPRDGDDHDHDGYDYGGGRDDDGDDDNDDGADRDRARRRPAGANVDGCRRRRRRRRHRGRHARRRCRMVPGPPVAAQIALSRGRGREDVGEAAASERGESGLEKHIDSLDDRYVPERVGGLRAKALKPFRNQL